MAGNDAFTKLLLHCDGIDASTTFVDSSASAHSPSSVAAAELDTAKPKFGTASGLFAGSHGATGAEGILLYADSADWDFGTGDFAIDLQVWFTSVGAHTVFCDRNRGIGAGDYEFVYTGTNLTLYHNGPAMIAEAWTPSTGQWYHLAVTRSGTNVRLFVDGTQLGSTATAGDDMTGANTLSIGSDVIRNWGVDGWIDEFRISKGVPRWTANFTSPTEPYSTRRVIVVS